MKQKYFLIFVIIAVISVIFVNGCIQEKPKPEIVKVPTIDLEATIVSLSLTNVTEDPQDILYPRDTGVIKIDKIISIDNPNNWNLEGIEEGNEIMVQFEYSARPAKIRRIPQVQEPTPTPAETPISGPTRTFTVENGYFVYILRSTSITKETEIILSGLEVGSKFGTTISYLSRDTISICEYKIIS